MGRETRAGVPAFFIPRTPNRPPCGREEWTPDSTPHVVHIFLLGCFLFWQLGQKSGRKSLWLSPLALRSPEEGTGLGIWSGQVKPQHVPQGSRACRDQGEQEALLPGHQKDVLQEVGFLLGLRDGAGRNVWAV